MVKLGAALFAALSLVSAVNGLCKRGIPWATDDRYSKTIGKAPRIEWVHHWEYGPVYGMPSKVQYVAMFWGPEKWGLWNDVKKLLYKKTPQYLFSFNEPDVSSQSNMSPGAAVSLYMKEIMPWSKKGTKIGSPAIVWNLKWMGEFLTQLKNKGGKIDFICIHWYGSWKDLAGFKKYVQAAHKLAGKPVWILEIGITTKSHGSQQNIKNFMMEAFTWLDTQSYVERAAWHGGYELNNPPDNYADNKNALFHPGGKMTDMAMWYAYSSKPDKRSIHHRLSASDLEHSNTTIADADAVHCDKVCQLRVEQMEFVNSLGIEA